MGEEGAGSRGRGGGKWVERGQGAGVEGREEGG